MKNIRIRGRSAILMIAVLASLLAMLSCSNSTEPPEIKYDWTLRIADLSNMEIPIGFQGVNIDIPVYLEMSPSETEIDSFSILIAHDYAATTFIQASPGVILSGWGEFNYSESKYYSGEIGTMMGLTKITAKRISSSASKAPRGEKEANASLSGNEMIELFTLRYYVTDDRNYACTITPLDFFWVNCNDNVIYYNSGQRLAYSDNVYGFSLEDIENPWYLMVPDDGSIDNSDHLYGTFDDCMSDNAGDLPKAEASIDFYDGVIEIPCPEPIDITLGDINLNDIPYEIGDAALLSNYFVWGDTVFVIDARRQILATDVNHDNEYPTLADLDYLIRVLTGDQMPPSHLQHKVDTVSVSKIGDTLSFSSEIDLGTAFFVFNGEINFDILDRDFEVKSDYVSGKTRILLYSLNGARFEAGSAPILKSDAIQQLDSCIFSGYYGSMVVTNMSE